MKYIKLVNGKGRAIVDDADYCHLSKHRWFLQSIEGKQYAVRNVKKGEKGYMKGKTRLLSMHKELLPAPPGYMRDHENGDGLDNRRSNLRLATNKQNNQNRKCHSASGYKGVYRYKKTAKWRAEIERDFLGIFDTPEKAALAYNIEAVKRFGLFARVNRVRSSKQS